MHRLYSTAVSDHQHLILLYTVTSYPLTIKANHCVSSQRKQGLDTGVSSFRTASVIDL